MPSTYSSNLKIELIATGEQDGTWGSTTNTNLGTALEQAITGTGTVTFASADVTLGFASSNASQDFRNIRLRLTGTTGGARNLIVPNIEKLYFIDNTTADTVTVKTAAGTGIAVPSGAKSVVYADGVNVVEAVTHLNSPSFSGTPTAPTAAVNTNTTQLATTAFVVAEIADQNLGTIATQDANNVAITGGSITGITDLAVADGGTGVSALTADNVILGDGTNPVKFVAPSTSGNLLTSNGTTWVSQAPSIGIQGQVFTGNGTFTIPTGVTRVKVTVVGGGGGGSGGGGFGQNGTRGGGGGGGAAIKYLTSLTPGNTLSVTVGAGGAGGVSDGAQGANGGNSTVSSGTQSITTITGGGGAGGALTFGTWTAGGTATNGDLNCVGGGAYSGSDGVGGNSILGGASASGTTPASGGLYGGGGSSRFNAAGSAGAAGVVIFEW